MQRLQGALEALPVPGQDRVVLGLALLAPQAQLALPVRGAQPPGPRCGSLPGAELQLGILLGRVLAAAAHRDPLVPMRPQPGEGFLRRQPGVHDHRRARPVAEQVAETGQGRGQGGGFGDVAGQDLAAAGEAGRVERQAEGDQRAIVAFLLRSAVAQVGARPAVIVHVRQIVKGNRRRQIEERTLTAEEGGFEGLAVVVEPVADAVELGQGRRRGGGQAEQFEGGGVLAEPGVGLAFGGGMQHAGEDEGDGDAGVAGGQAEVLEGVGEAQFAEGVEGEAFGPDGAHEAVVEGVEVDEGEVVVGGVGQGGEAEAVGDLLGGAEQVGIGLEEGVWPERMDSIRSQRAGQSSGATGNCAPRLSRVTWRTELPERTLRTRRQEE